MATTERTDWVEVIHDIADEVGGEVRADYSGRGMYGKTCYGIVCSDPGECREVAATAGLRHAKVDNMGRDYIVYWPTVTGASE